MIVPSSNPLTMLLDVFKAPASAFWALHEKPMWGWQSFIVLLVTPFLFWGAYFDTVDFAWLKSQLTEFISADNLAALESNTLMATEIINDLLGRITTIALLAFWFLLATKNYQQPKGYWNWFAASTLVTLPLILADIASYVSLLLNNGWVVNYAADLGSLNGLLKLPVNHSWFGYAQSFPLLMPWFIVLGFTALSCWTPISRSAAIVVSGLPWVGTYTVWAIYLLVS